MTHLTYETLYSTLHGGYKKAGNQLLSILDTN